MTRRVAVVFAHPDDDTYGVGASLALHADEDVAVTAILTTSGEAGLIADESLATRGTLAAVREREDAAAWRALGLEPELHFLRYPDGAVQDVRRDELVGRYLEILRAATPQVVITFGPDGVTGHADHVRVGEVATEAFHAARQEGLPGFDRLLHGGLMRSQMDRFNALLGERGLEPIDETAPFQPRAIADERFGVVVDGSSIYERKLAALREHATQAELHDIPMELWPAMLQTEAFVLAWPERSSDDPVLHDVFEALPPA
jgi:LmbE family N-acetylglucosaminyl deacetylase